MCFGEFIMRQRVESMLRSNSLKIIRVAIAIRLLGISPPYIANESMCADGVKFLSVGAGSGNRININLPSDGGAIPSHFSHIVRNGYRKYAHCPADFGIGVMCSCYLLSRELYDKKVGLKMIPQIIKMRLM